MSALERQLLQLIFVRVTALNGEETEADLNLVISENIMRDNLNDFIKNNLVVETLKGEPDLEEKIIDNGVFVYNYKSLINWSFNKYNTIADAVRAAIKTLNATIICNGKVITYDILDDESAYYIDTDDNKMKIVTI